MGFRVGEIEGWGEEHSCSDCELQYESWVGRKNHRAIVSVTPDMAEKYLTIEAQPMREVG